MKKLCLTFDDLPGASLPRAKEQHVDFLYQMNQQITDCLAEHAISAIGFVSPHNEDPCAPPPVSQEALTKILQLWINAGCQLGNHSDSHHRPLEIGTEAYLRDIELVDQHFHTLFYNQTANTKYYRHPYLHTGSTRKQKEQIEQYLVENGYTIAPATFYNRDWAFAENYARAVDLGSEQERGRIVDLYLEYTKQLLRFFEELSQELFGCSVPQTVCIHANPLHAKCLPALLSLFQEHGYSFCALSEALADPAYAIPDGYIGDDPPSWIHRWALSRGVALKSMPPLPEGVEEVARARMAQKSSSTPE